MLIISFGLPGAGKTYVGHLMHKHFGYTFYDGDHDLTDTIRDAIATKSPFTDDMRNEFFSTLLISMEKRVKIHDKLVVAQTFIKERYRQQALERFPEAHFILVKTQTAIREKRLADRVAMPLGRAYSRQMVRNFEQPQIDHAVIHNNKQGEEAAVKQLQTILQEIEG